MANMGKYCKAYPIEQFRAFQGWKENSQNIRKGKQQVDGKEIPAPRELTTEDFLYLQENFAVTDGIFMDENIIFADFSQEWIDYCTLTLKFEVPIYQTVVAS